MGASMVEESLYESLLTEETKVEHTCCDNITPFILMIGLGLHAVFEGMAMGAENRKAKTLIFALAIFLHKGAAGMSFGISLQKAFADR